MTRMNGREGGREGGEEEVCVCVCLKSSCKEMRMS
jgi:hypothetical protein